MSLGKTTHSPTMPTTISKGGNNEVRVVVSAIVNTLVNVKMPRIALAVFKFVAFEVTVKVTLLDESAVNVAEPDRPVPDVAIVKVPLLGADSAAQVWSPRKYVELLAVPEAKRAVATVPEDRLEAFKVVRLAPETAPNEPDQVPEVIVPTDTKLAAVVILGCDAVVTVPAVVALVAVVALPLKVAVIVPAEKLPEASRATIVEAPLDELAVV